jgi:hypothetical protein
MEKWFSLSYNQAYPCSFCEPNTLLANPPDKELMRFTRVNLKSLRGR